MSVACREIQRGQCEITQGYKAGVHNGIDIVNKGYTLGYITAHSAGVVVGYRKNYNTTDKTGGSYGNYVKIKHDNGYYTLYAHMKYNTVSVITGARVSKGQVIGYMGNTGHSYGGHLHFEVRNASDVKIDPTPYLNKDLPSVIKNNIIYQTHDKVAHKYWSEVTNYNNKDSNGYAGYIGHSIDGIRARATTGVVTIQSHIRGETWLPPITKWDNSASGYSGIYGKDIDMIMVKCSAGTVRYRVGIKGGDWLPWVSKFDINDSVNGMAGIYGKSIDRIQMEII